MGKYDALVDGAAATESIFADKSAEPEVVVSREAYERQLATILIGGHEGYLPITVSVYGSVRTGRWIS